MQRGHVRWFNDRKGYGFINCDDGGADIFVHHSEILGGGYRSLTMGQYVEFEIFRTQRGRQARAVAPVEDSALRSGAVVPVRPTPEVPRDATRGREAKAVAAFQAR